VSGRGVVAAFIEVPSRLRATSSSLVIIIDCGTGHIKFDW
jgi:hypothetical protein